MTPKQKMEERAWRHFALIEALHSQGLISSEARLLAHQDLVAMVERTAAAWRAEMANEPR